MAETLSNSVHSSAAPQPRASDTASPSTSSTLALRTPPHKRPRKQKSTASLASRTSRSKRLRPDISRTSSAVSVTSRPSASRNNSALSVKQLLNHADDVAITSGDETDAVKGVSASVLKSVLTSSMGDETLLEKPDWAVRHRIYLDSELLSTTTATRRPGLHKFQDILLREQCEIRLHTPHSGQDAHFATRHATLRFWRNDGTLAEKWMDKDMGGDQEHEFAMENLNDWAIINLAMGDDVISTDSDAEDTMDADDEQDQVIPTMDIISHYISDYDDARNIASAPGIDTDDESELPPAPTSDARPVLLRQNSNPIYHWVEERRRALEHQLRSLFHCSTCESETSVCLALRPDQHLPLSPKDLTDWSQQIAHAHRSIAATTLHLAAKLADDATRFEDEDLAAEMQEREDEDDLALVLERDRVLAEMRPEGADAEPADLETLA